MLEGDNVEKSKNETWVGAIERLEGMLNHKDIELESAQKELRELKEQATDADWRWARHQIYKKDAEPLPILSVPRLEVRWTSIDDDHYHLLATYSLVRRHLLGHLVFVPLGATRVGGSMDHQPIQANGQLQLPFREGAHIHHDMKALNLPGYVVYYDPHHRQDKFLKLDPEKRLA